VGRVAVRQRVQLPAKTSIACKFQGSEFRIRLFRLADDVDNIALPASFDSDVAVVARNRRLASRCATDVVRVIEDIARLTRLVDDSRCFFSLNSRGSLSERRRNLRRTLRNEHSQFLTKRRVDINSSQGSSVRDCNEYRVSRSEEKRGIRWSVGSAGEG
jgi:hypothetical protein